MLGICALPFLLQEKAGRDWLLPEGGNGVQGEEEASPVKLDIIARE
jgi:hypothetical protein